MFYCECWKWIPFILHFLLFHSFSIWTYVLCKSSIVEELNFTHPLLMNSTICYYYERNVCKQHQNPMRHFTIKKNTQTKNKKLLPWTSFCWVYVCFFPFTVILSVAVFSSIRHSPINSREYQCTREIYELGACV